MKTERIHLEYQVADSVTSLEATDRNLVREAQLAQEKAYAPYSRYPVGAALIREDGSIVPGNNQENAAYPSGLCAERVALFSASATLPNVAVKTIAIVAPSGEFDPAAPCGGCRQVLMEYETKQGSPIRILLKGDGENIWIFKSVHDLLPFSFTRERLKKEAK